MEIAARYSDGKVAASLAVTIAPAAGGIEIRFGGEAPPRLWPFAETRIEEANGEARLHRVLAGEDTGERITAPAPAFRATFAAALPRFGKGRAGEISGARIALWCGAALASLAFLYFVGLPAFARLAAPLVPWRWEASLGRAVEPQVLDYFGKGKPPRLCGTEGSPGKRALEAMTAKLAAGAKLPAPLRVDVIDTRETNAFALPGARIFIFRPIIEKAANPDEVAGVLAHEIGHVIHRDAMRGLIHDGALSLIIGAMIGDVTGGSTVTILSKMMLGSAYSRENEAEADAVSVDLMRKAGADPGAINAFFRRLSALEGRNRSVLDALRTHPVTSERIAKVERLAGELPPEARPILDAAEWRALKDICAETRPAGSEAG